MLFVIVWQKKLISRTAKFSKSAKPNPKINPVKVNVESTIEQRMVMKETNSNGKTLFELKI